MLPQAVNPMLAQEAQAPFDSAQHFFELKWDGIRCLAFIEAGRVRLQTRHLTEITSQLPEMACLERLPSGTILDGELVVMQQGRPSLRQIQRRTLLRSRAGINCISDLMPVTYMVFDLLYLRGNPLFGAPLHDRRQELQRIIGRAALTRIVVSDALLEDGCKLFAEVDRLGLEGIIAKRLDSPYLAGKRSRHWLKIKTARVSLEALSPALTTPDAL